VLNGALFVLVGMELQTAVRGLTSASLTRGVIAIAAVSAVMVAVRIAWLFTTVYLIRVLDRRPQQRLRRVPARARVLSGLSGFRGAVSLAAALAVPARLNSGAPFPGRDLTVFITAGVITVTLAQALLLPAVVRWARLPEDIGVARERRLAETRANEAALDQLPQVAAELGTDPDVAQRLRREYEEHLRVLHASGHERDDSVLQLDQQYAALRLALLARKREAVLALRDENTIDDIVLRQVQTRLHAEEVRLSRPQLAE
jgi:CPA1 family monovalent cation:H+ antiporter